MRCRTTSSQGSTSIKERFMHLPKPFFLLPAAICPNTPLQPWTAIVTNWNSELVCTMKPLPGINNHTPAKEPSPIQQIKALQQ